MPFQIFSKNSQKSSDSKSSLLSKTEFKKLEKNMKTLYLTGLFQKNQATARFIAKYQKAKLNSTYPFSMNEFLKSIYNETPQDQIPVQIHKLFVQIAMNEDIDSYHPVPAENTNKSSIDLESSFANTVTVHTASTSANAVDDETTTIAVVPDVIFAETTTTAVVPVVVAAESASTVVVPDAVFAESTTNVVVPDVVAATPVVIPTGAAPTSTTTITPPIAATTATKTILLSSNTILFSADDEDPEDEEEFDFQAIHNTTTSFKSKLFNTWYKTKIRSKAFRIKSVKQIKKLFTFF
ncbi:uncharacterized protein J8A68_005312, partial [[Candida] subhashii]